MNVCAEVEENHIKNSSAMHANFWADNFIDDKTAKTDPVVFLASQTKREQMCQNF